MLMSASPRSPLLIPGALATPSSVREDREDGSFVLRSTRPLEPYARCIGDWLVHWATHTPRATFPAEPVYPGGVRNWRTVTYAGTLDLVRRIGQSLLDMDLPADAPVVALSDNSINLALLSLGAMHVGCPVTVISSAYSRAAKDYGKLHAILAQLGPALIYAEDGELYSPAIEAFRPRCPVVNSRHTPSHAIDFSSLTKSGPTDAVDRAFDAITPGATAKLLLTSGSTGKPKVVVNTHRMLCANQQMIAQCWPFVDRAQPVVLDWLPWSHTMGSNHEFNLVLRNGGTFCIDDGRPVAGLIARTVENLKDIHPTLFFNVPRGYDALLPLLETDPAAARALFGRLEMLFFAAAALPRSTAERLCALAATVRDDSIFLTTEWGATETSPVVTSAHFKTSDPRNIGVPVPGIELKFVPCLDKFEMRVRGPSVFSEYREDPEKTAAAFDDEGFYRIGDAGLLVDPLDPHAGVMFDRRVEEDFKLTTGTWVSVSALRVRVLETMAPYVQDVVVAGHDCDEIGLLLFPSADLRRLAGDEEGVLSGHELSAQPHVRDTLRRVLMILGEGVGSSQRPERAIVLSEPPSLEKGEITDKGYINQRKLLSERADEVERLYTNHRAVIHAR